MNAETKKEFQRKIAQANRSGLVVIMYDMLLTYLRDALTAYNELNKKSFAFNLDMARQCIRELRGNLDFNYHLSENLFSIYNFADRELAKDLFGCKNDNIDEIIIIFKMLRDAFEKASVNDKSETLMGNTQEVYAGITYGKTSLNETVDFRQSTRGFLV